VSSEHYKKKILEISLLLNQAQKPIQILDAVKWNDDLEYFFIKNNFKELPKIDRDYYLASPLKYDPLKKINEFRDIQEKIKLDIGENDPLGAILLRNCEEFEKVIFMLMNRGTTDFYKYSKELYGSPSELLNDGNSKLSDLSTTLKEILGGLSDQAMGVVYEKNLSSEVVVEELQKRLSSYFQNEKIKIKLSDGIISDASAGSDYIKIKKGMNFSIRDIHIFEVHEGWVHLGTTLNGDAQDYAKWLSKGPPCSTVTQEGLAVLMELFNFALYPRRAKRLNDRLIACKMAEEGANVLEVIEYFRLQGQDEMECIKNAGRVYRGAPLEGGAPFTKDISYLKGFIEIYNFLRTTIKNGNPEIIPFLFAGKVTLQDVPVLYQYHQEGVINFPKYLPPQIKDLNGIAVWMAFSNFFNKMKLDAININEAQRKLKKVC
jgi:uncharacterized protein (TIGR02421 family)